MYLTKRQNHILTYIQSTIAMKGYPPSVREIANAVGLASTSTVHGHLDRLERKGLIRRGTHKCRALELVGFEGYDSNNTLQFIRDQTNPCSKINATGKLSSLGTEQDLYKQTTIIKIEEEILNCSEIHPGDHVFVEKQAVFNIGDIVVVFEENQKKYEFYNVDNSTLLLIGNMAKSIVGKVTGVLRFSIPRTAVK